MSIESHRDLTAWQKAMDLVVEVYHLTEHFPKSEARRLRDQLRRAVVSVPANIAGGSARSTSKDYAHFLTISRGSLVETETYLLLAVRLRYLTEDQIAPTVSLGNEVGKMLMVLRRKLVP